MTKVRYLKCAQNGCTQVATWKAGTWWFCKEHMKEWSTKIDGVWYSGYGTVNNFGPCRPEDYFIGDYPESMTVEVEKG